MCKSLGSRAHTFEAADLEHKRCNANRNTGARAVDQHLDTGTGEKGHKRGDWSIVQLKQVGEKKKQRFHPFAEVQLLLGFSDQVWLDAKHDGKALCDRKEC